MLLWCFFLNRWCVYFLSFNIPLLQKASLGLILFTNGGLGWVKHQTLQWLGCILAAEWEYFC
jgi:hypothetical protein